MDIFVGRQPVFTKARKTFGYELLFREGFRNMFPGIDGDTATSKLLSNTFFSMGFDRITGNRPGLINFTKELITAKIPLVFPKNRIIIEILENIEPDSDIIEAVREFREKGYKIALDDFVFHEKYESLIALSHIIKFDIRSTPLDTIEPLVRDIFKTHRIKLLAEKVETHEEFGKAVEMGFSLFQGYFFAKPEVLSAKAIPSNQLTLIELVSEVSGRDTDIEKLSRIIRADVSLTYKLLKFINSAYFKRVYEIDTVKDAIAYLGLDEMKKFINVAAAAGMSEGKPDELMRVSLIRARMCELFGLNFDTGFSPDELFTMGLFSLMDAMLDRKMEAVLPEISFSPRIKKGLLGQDRVFTAILDEVKCFETGDWTECFMSEEKIESFERQQLPGFYLDAVAMADSFFL